MSRQELRNRRPAFVCIDAPFSPRVRQTIDGRVIVAAVALVVVSVIAFRLLAVLL